MVGRLGGRLGGRLEWGGKGRWAVWYWVFVVGVFEGGVALRS